jgi:chemotaxis response regulator CheB
MTLSRQSEILSALLVAPPGATEEALRAVLASIPKVEIIGVVAGCLSAAEAMRRLAPELVLLSGQIPTEEILTLIEQSAHERQAPRVVVLSSSHVLEQRFLAAGAFAVLTPWDPVDRLQVLIGSGAAIQARDEGNGHGLGG